ncbi:TPA: mechanosensitive ion channel family protein [bacterium]|nr:mechanosensitive ion channel family protein [bacterium]
MEELQARFNKFVEDFLKFTWAWDLLQALIRVLIVVVICFIVYKIVVFIMTKYISLAKGDINKKRAKTINNLIRSFMRYIFVVIGVIFSLQYLGLDPATIFAGAGVIGIVIGFAFQDLLKDIVAGFFIIIEKSYNVGDLVEIDGTTGTITNIGIKTTTFVAYTGEVIIINNRDISKVINFSSANYCITVNNIVLSYEDDINKFIDIFNSKIDYFKEKFPEIIDAPKIMGLNSFEGVGYLVEIHTKVKTLSQYNFRRTFYLEILKMCKEHGFTHSIPIIKKDRSEDDKNDYNPT